MKKTSPRIVVAVGCFAAVVTLVFIVGIGNWIVNVMSSHQAGQAMLSGNGKVQVFQRKAFRDDINPVDAGTILVPENWTLDSKFLWNYTCGNACEAMVRVWNSNGFEGINIYSEVAYIESKGFVNSVGIYVPPIADGQSIAYFMSLHQFPNPADYISWRLKLPELALATLVESEDMPALAAAVMLRPENGLDQPSNVGKEARVTRLRYEYPIKSFFLQEDIYCINVIQQIPNNLSATYWSMEIFAYRAEKGKLEDAAKILATIQQSLQPTQEWLAAVDTRQQVLRQNSSNAIDETNLRSQMIASSQREISQGLRTGFAERQEVMARAAKKFDQSIRGVETQYDPVMRRSVEVPSGYSNIWTNPAGDIIQTNDPNYTPMTDPGRGGTGWNRMERAK